jgi:hypothetical protein
MDANMLKGRIAEAFVEGVLRRAGYQVATIGRESRVQHLLKVGRDQFLPDFLVWKPVEQSSSSWPSCRLVGVEVKYRRDVSAYLQQEFASSWSAAIAQWPELYFVLVTDQPEPGRSCFQVIRPEAPAPDAAMQTVDLHDLRELDVYKRNVAEHENLVKVIFPLLGSPGRSQDLPRMPAARAAGRAPLLHVATQ